MMNRKITIISIFLLLGVLIVTSCSPKESGTELPSSTYLPEVPRIGVEEVRAKLDADSNIVIVDSRSRAIYDQSHVAGAISIPITTMAEPYNSLNGSDEIVIYCT